MGNNKTMTTRKNREMARVIGVQIHTLFLNQIPERKYNNINENTVAFPPNN